MTIQGGWSNRTNPETLQSYYERTALDPRTQKRDEDEELYRGISICVGIGTGGFRCLLIPPRRSLNDSKNQERIQRLEAEQKKQQEAEQNNSKPNSNNNQKRN
ncbi:MAG: hypothetical protein H7A10_04890 [Oceanospirillaceae bacterium]|nr:hypothetical protein [Oceanospirillaceae bacterium]